MKRIFLLTLVSTLLVPLHLCFAQPRYQLQVENGYGSGSYAEGDTVYIWAKEFAEDSVFKRWTSTTPIARLFEPMEWNTRLIMPAADVQLHADFAYSPPLQWGETDVRIGALSKHVWFSIPGNPRAIITLHHFTNGRGKVWTERTEYTQFCHAARALGYALLAYNCDEVDRGSQDGNQLDQWKGLPIAIDANPDHYYTRALLDSLIKRGLISATTPVFGVGMSVGGGYTLGVSMALGYKAWANYCSGGQLAIADTTRIPGIQAPAINDANAEDAPPGENNKRAREVYERLVERGVSARWLQNLAQPLYPERFARVQGISKATSRALFSELQQGGFLDMNNIPIVQSDTLEYFIKNRPALLPQFSSLSERLWKEALFQYRVAYADHEFHTNYSYATLRFFEDVLNTSSTKDAEAEQFTRNVSVVPQPSLGDVCIHLPPTNDITIIEVCNVLGKVVYDSVIPAGSSSFPLSLSLPAGSYLLRLRWTGHHYATLFQLLR